MALITATISMSVLYVLLCPPSIVSLLNGQQRTRLPNPVPIAFPCVKIYCTLNINCVHCGPLAFKSLGIVVLLWYPLRMLAVSRSSASATSSITGFCIRSTFSSFCYFANPIQSNKSLTCLLTYTLRMRCSTSSKMNKDTVCGRIGRGFGGIVRAARATSEETFVIRPGDGDLGRSVLMKTYPSGRRKSSHCVMGGEQAVFATEEFRCCSSFAMSFADF